jgi:hypothetical protein
MPQVSSQAFRDRVEAGELLAESLAEYRDRDDVIVLALPRGGVPVAAEIARHLHVPLDVTSPWTSSSFASSACPDMKSSRWARLPAAAFAWSTMKSSARSASLRM